MEEGQGSSERERGKDYGSKREPGGVRISGTISVKVLGFGGTAIVLGTKGWLLENSGVQ